MNNDICYKQDKQYILQSRHDTLHRYNNTAILKYRFTYRNNRYETSTSIYPYIVTF